MSNVSCYNLTSTNNTILGSSNLNTLIINATTNINGDLTTTANLNTQNITASGNLTCNNSSFNGNVLINSTYTFTSGTGQTTLNGALYVVGSSTFLSSITCNSSITGSSLITAGNCNCLNLNATTIYENGSTLSSQYLKPSNLNSLTVPINTSSSITGGSMTCNGTLNIGSNTLQLQDSNHYIKQNATYNGPQINGYGNVSLSVLGTVVSYCGSSGFYSTNFYEGGTALTSKYLQLAGTTAMTGALTNNSGVASTSVGTGSIIISGLGGLSVNGNIYSAGQNFVTNSTPSTSVGTGALIVTGGISTGNRIWATGQINCGGAINTTNGNTSTSTSTGSIVCSGGLGCAGNLYLGGLLNVAGSHNIPTGSYTAVSTAVTINGNGYATQRHTIALTVDSLTITLGSGWNDGSILFLRNLVGTTWTVNRGTNTLYNKDNASGNIGMTGTRSMIIMYTTGNVFYEMMRNA